MYEVTFLMCSAEIPEVAPAEVTEAFFLRAKASRRTAASQLALHYNTEAAVNTTTVGCATHNIVIVHFYSF